MYAAAALIPAPARHVTAAATLRPLMERCWRRWRSHPVMLSTPRSARSRRGAGYRGGALVRAAMKYDRDAIPAVLTSAVDAHNHFGPRTWLAGRRLSSISIAALRAASAAAAAMTLRRC